MQILSIVIDVIFIFMLIGVAFFAIRSAKAAHAARLAFEENTRSTNQLIAILEDANGAIIEIEGGSLTTRKVKH